MACDCCARGRVDNVRANLGQFVRELKNVYAAGKLAAIDAINPYRGPIVSAAVWRAGYRKMIEAMLAKSPARQAYLRNHEKR